MNIKEVRDRARLITMARVSVPRLIVNRSMSLARASGTEILKLDAILGHEEYPAEVPLECRMDIEQFVSLPEETVASRLGLWEAYCFYKRRQYFDQVLADEMKGAMRPGPLVRVKSHLGYPISSRLPPMLITDTRFDRHCLFIDAQEIILAPKIEQLGEGQVVAHEPMVIRKSSSNLVPALMSALYHSGSDRVFRSFPVHLARRILRTEDPRLDDYDKALLLERLTVGSPAR